MFVEGDNMIIKSRDRYLLIILVVLSLFISCGIGLVSGMESNSSDDAKADVAPEAKETDDGTSDISKEANGETTDLTLKKTSDDSIQKPTWQVGDQWSMGYTLDLADTLNDIKSILESMDGKINRLKIEGEVGMYQSAEVQDNNAEITIDETSYKCYKVYFEQYLGLVAKIDVDVEMTIPEYDEYDYDDDYEEYDEKYVYGTRARAFESTQPQIIKIREKEYIWMNADITGHIYYTLDDLAIVKGDFDLFIDGEIDMKVDGSTPDGMIAIELRYMFDNVNARSEVTYDPPLDIFDFPIEPDESWTARSMMTQTLTKLSGRISYDISMEVPDLPATSMKEEMDLGSEVTTPDIYGPVCVSYDFYNSGLKNIDLLNGMNSECLIIESSDDEWYFDYDEYDEYDDDNDKEIYEEDDSDRDRDDEMIAKEESISSSFSIMPPSPSPLPLPFNDGSSDFDLEAESMYNPIDSSANSKNYYSPDEGNIISYEPSDENAIGSVSAAPFSTTNEKTLVTPKTYNEVTNFKTKDRAEMKNRYPRNSGSGTDNDFEALTIMMIGITAVFVIILIVTIMIQNSRKKVNARNARYKNTYGNIRTGQRANTPVAVADNYSSTYATYDYNTYEPQTHNSQHYSPRANYTPYEHEHEHEQHHVQNSYYNSQIQIPPVEQQPARYTTRNQTPYDHEVEEPGYYMPSGHTTQADRTYHANPNQTYETHQAHQTQYTYDRPRVRYDEQYYNY